MDPLGDLVRLTQLVPPPDSPVRAFGDWKRFVSVNGFQPPDDYRMFVREYGAGTFADWARLIEPFDPSETFKEKLEKECRSMPPSSNGLGRWPQAGGFLPWAVTSDGSFVGWRTEGRPISWPTVLLSPSGQTSEYPVGAVGFLLTVAERGIAQNGSAPVTLSNPAFSPASG